MDAISNTPSAFPEAVPAKPNVWQHRLMNFLLQGLICIMCWGAAMQWHFYRTEIDLVTDDLRRLASVAALQVDGDIHQKLTSPDQAGGEIYRRALQPLARMQKAMPEINCIYTAVLRGKGDYRLILFTLSGAAESKNGALPRPSRFMDPLSGNVSPALVLALEKGESFVTPNIYTYSYGKFLSGFAPFRNSHGDVVGVVGLDVDMQEFEKRMKSAGEAWYINVFLLAIAACAVFLYATRIRTAGAEAMHNANASQA